MSRFAQHSRPYANGFGNGTAYSASNPASRSGTPSGRSNTPSGRSNTPSGRSNTPSGRSQTPSGRSAYTPAGRSSTPAGRSNTPSGGAARVPAPPSGLTVPTARHLTQRSISLQPPNRAAAGPSKNGSVSSLASSSTTSSGGLRAPPALSTRSARSSPAPASYGSGSGANGGQFKRSASVEPSLNDPTVQARIGNRATKVVNKSIGTCGTCRKPITEDGCTAFGKVYHKACFKCFVCKQRIQGKFFEKDGKPYCQKDFQDKAPNCSNCGKKITRMLLTARGKYYHPDCLTCEVCGDVLSGDFYMLDGQLVCKKEVKQATESCTVCQQPIKGDSVVSNNKSFHPECMKCYVCGVGLRGTYFTFQDKPICEKDYKECADKCSSCGEAPSGTYYSLNGKTYCQDCRADQAEKCPKCSQEVSEGKVVRIAGASYHPDCFVCVVCKKNMINVPFVADDKKMVYCTEDYNKKRAPRCAFCKKPIVPKEGQKTAPRLRALDRDFHPQCFQCEDCGLVLDSRVKGRECYPYKSHVLCKKCNRKKLSSSESEDDDDDDSDAAEE